MNHNGLYKVYKLSVMIPSNYVESVKEAMFSAGAGHYEHYDKCCWQTSGTGQFRALEGSQPFSGSKGSLHKEETWKIEMICLEKYLKDVIKALKTAHPYEVPCFDIIPIFTEYPLN